MQQMGHGQARVRNSIQVSHIVPGTIVLQSSAKAHISRKSDHRKRQARISSTLRQVTQVTV